MRRKSSISTPGSRLAAEDEAVSATEYAILLALLVLVAVVAIRGIGERMYNIYENIDAVIEFAVRHDTDFHQFMLYTPVAGTPLHTELSAQGRMKDESEFHPGDIHGQYIFNYRHPHIKNGQEAEFMVRAFRRDFQVNGPSVVRIARTTLAGWKRYKNHPDPRIRRRFVREAEDLAITNSAVVSAARKYYDHEPHLRTKMSMILQELHREFGVKSRLAATFGGLFVLWKIRMEEKRLAAGWTYEPPTIYEKNYGFDGPGRPNGPVAAPCRFVTPRVVVRQKPAASDHEQPIHEVLVDAAGTTEKRPFNNGTTKDNVS